MRTVRHATAAINPGKLKALGALVRAFNAERGAWVETLKALDNLAVLDGSGVRKLRDAHVKAGYISPNGLQARGWKLALTEAAALIDRHWQAQLLVVKNDINNRRTLPDNERHLLFYALRSYGMLADVLAQREPEAITKKFGPLLAPDRRKNQLRWLRRRLKSMLRNNRLPTVKAERSVVFDANCYKVFLNKGGWYIGLAGLTPGKRIVVPLLGDAEGIRGNIRLTLDGDHAEIHVQHALCEPWTVPLKVAVSGKPVPVSHGTTKAVDAGFTEVCVDNKGIVYGAGFGKRMKAFAEARNVKGQRRNSLRAVAKRACERGDEGKARRIEGHNLGTVKQTATLARSQATILRHVGQAVNELLVDKPAAVVHEDLSRAKFKFQYGATSNRSLSTWARGVYMERLEFKARVRGSHLVAVNPAYSSQLCPACGFVDKENRSGDRFRCLLCKHSGAADQVAATNLLARASDSEIQCWMSPPQVKTLLLDRYTRRLEAAEVAQAAGAVTVAGPTSDVVSATTRAPRSLKKLHSGESLNCGSPTPVDHSKSEQCKPGTPAHAHILLGGFA